MMNGNQQANNRVLFRGGSLITGDGRTMLETGSIRVRAGVIAQLSEGMADAAEGETVISTEGLMMLPGFINGHAHATIAGPSMPSGSPPLSPAQVSWQRNRHLLSGTTSLINVCGLAMTEERDGELGAHPMDIHMTSAHTPHSILAADEIDGRGLTPRHRHSRIDDLVLGGCRVLGEAGGGQTLGGGAQDYRFIPDAIEEYTGLRISVQMARRMKEAVLGRRLDGRATASERTVKELLVEATIADKISTLELRGLLERYVLAPVEHALVGLKEVADAAVRHNLPAIFHHAAPTAETLLLLKQRYPALRMIAAHANHPSFLTDEAVDYAVRLKDLGATIDISTLDVVETRFRNGPETFDALVEAGLVDTISTDFAGGDWDTIPSALHRMTRVNRRSLTEAVALATGNVARVFPEIFDDRGLLAVGKRADLVMTEAHNISRIRHVFIAGQARVWNGALLSA
ncbi:amidohydrolase family protein [Allorhizobium sp. NPDC080224]|uniref:amidohydrolase family protein n=1 Tax=Allorhizobium sp. NPDC080224 TaxID=3390547 RepID=UPI003D0689C4